MRRLLPPALLLAIACGAPPPAAPRPSAAPPPAAVEAEGAGDEERDPILEAMALLKAARDDPGDGEARRLAVEAFLALERDARERGEIEAAGRYRAVAADLAPPEGEAGVPAWEDPGPALDAVVPHEPPAPLDGLRLGTHHFTVRISGAGAARSAEAVVGILEEAYLTVCGAMAANPDGKVPVILYTDREFREETGLPEWVGGAYDGTIHLPLAGLDPTAPRARNVVVHEFVHAFNFQVAGGRCPLWLDEGLAQYFEAPRPRMDARALSAAARGGGLPPLTAPSFLMGGPAQAATLYQMALSAVLCLEERASLAALSSFLQSLGTGTPAREAFGETFLFPYDRLQDEVAAWLERKAQ